MRFEDLFERRKIVLDFDILREGYYITNERDDLLVEKVEFSSELFDFVYLFRNIRLNTYLKLTSKTVMEMFKAGVFSIGKGL